MIADFNINRTRGRTSKYVKLLPIRAGSLVVGPAPIDHHIPPIDQDIVGPGCLIKSTNESDSDVSLSLKRTIKASEGTVKYAGKLLTR